jgi:hypothetical protein
LTSKVAPLHQKGNVSFSARTLAIVALFPRQGLTESSQWMTVYYGLPQAIPASSDGKYPHGVPSERPFLPTGKQKRRLTTHRHPGNKASTSWSCHEAARPSRRTHPAALEILLPLRSPARWHRTAGMDPYEIEKRRPLSSEYLTRASYGWHPPTILSPPTHLLPRSVTQRPPRCTRRPLSFLHLRHHRR